MPNFQENPVVHMPPPDEMRAEAGTVLSKVVLEPVYIVRSEVLNKRVLVDRYSPERHVLEINYKKYI